MSLFSKTTHTTIQAACGCSTGLRRSVNEDNFYFDGIYLDSENDGLEKVLARQINMPAGDTDDGVFFAVFDGMGGGQYGEIASNLAAVTAERFLSDKSNICRYDISPSLTEMCFAMNDEVYSSGEDLGASQMGSTLAGLYYFAGNVWSVNLGDSKCYLFRKGILYKLSVDHTDEESMRINGITGRKPYITQYLGVDRNEMRISPAISRNRPDTDDVFLITSDGLTDMVSETAIAQILASEKNPIKAAEILISEALANGGKDNITVILNRIAN